MSPEWRQAIVQTIVIIIVFEIGHLLGRRRERAAAEMALRQAADGKARPPHVQKLAADLVEGAAILRRATTEIERGADRIGSWGPPGDIH